MNFALSNLNLTLLLYNVLICKGYFAGVGLQDSYCKLHLVVGKILINFCFELCGFIFSCVVLQPGHQLVYTFVASQNLFQGKKIVFQATLKLQDVKK